MKVCIIGSGNGALATAYDFASYNHDVYLCDIDRFKDNLELINRTLKITSIGNLVGSSSITYAGTDFALSMKNADIIIVVGPAFSTNIIAEKCKNHIKKGQIVLISPGSCGGALVFKKELGLDINDDSIIVAELSTLPYAVRHIEENIIEIYLKLKGGVYLSSLPSNKNQDVLDLIKEVYPYIIKADSVLKTIFQNGNPVIHPSVTLLNASLIERTNGDFFFYKDGVTKASGLLIEAIDKERSEIAKAYNIDIMKDPELGVIQGYMSEENYNTGYSKAKGFEGIKAQSDINNRYIKEDVGYGLILLIHLAKLANIEVPVMESIVTIASVITNTDFKNKDWRNLKDLGLQNMNKGEIIKVLSN